MAEEELWMMFGDPVFWVSLLAVISILVTIATMVFEAQNFL